MKPQWIRASQEDYERLADAHSFALREMEQLRAALAAAEAKLAEWKDGAVNDACGDALELLWRDVMLANKPDYGPWEYPGYAYRHLLAEFNDLKAALADERRHAASAWRALEETRCTCEAASIGGRPTALKCVKCRTLSAHAARRAAEVANGTA